MVLLLNKMGVHHVREACDGRSALAAFEDKDESLDLVICDLDMPEMDGMELIRRIGASGKSPSMIVASALAPDLLHSVEQMTRAQGVRLLGSIEKPATPEKLMPMLDGACNASPRAGARGGLKFSIDEIRAGLEGGEFEAFMQPKVRIQDGTVAGAEALARWRHPKHGLLFPAAFIGPIESEGEVDALTWAMLRSASASCKAWRKSGLAASVSVNLSPSTISNPASCEKILQIVREADLETKAVVLEVTETIAMTHVATSLENLIRLRMRGFGLAIDDFGTGHSSLQQLSRVPFTELKIDRSFVNGAAEQPRLRAILETGIGVAARLGIESVAEGMETHEDWDLLAQLHCDIAQGYFVAKPMEARAFPDWAAGWKTPG
jgi:EAL domain-containing protein (putative c-di-GMP-specific phosphodiesterase class I)